ncbi:MAG: M28 family peptidase [Flavobacteriaceae bacterium]|nr:M28 family peptidase [Flavobacteriaceae bacterium]
MGRILIAIVSISLFYSCGTAQNTSEKIESPKEIISPVVFANSITLEELKTDLYKYASDEFEGRETGAPGQKKAVEFLKTEYIKLGIPSPIAEDDYFQEVPLVVGKSPKASITIDDKVYEHISDFITFSSNATQDFSEDEIVYAGYGIADENYSDYKDLDVKDKVVLIKSGEPKNEDGTYMVSGTAESTKWSAMRQEYRAKANVAKDKGVKTLIFYNNDLFPMMSKRYEAVEKRGGMGRMSLKGAEDDMFVFLIGDSVNDAIMASADKEVQTATIDLDLKVSYTSQSDDIQTENVLALIEGSEKPEEVIVISAHLDHIGVENGEINNGADDDGSGTVALLEIAEAFKLASDKGNRPKRSILFLHVTGEEKGLLGSRYYTDVDPVFPLENTVVNLNIDMIGRTDPKRDSSNRNYIYLIGSDKLSTELHNISEEVNGKHCNIEFDYTFNDENDPNRFYYRSDHYNFAKNNIPVIFYFSGTHADYHQPTDTPDKIDYDLLENRTRLVFHTAWELANRENRIVVDKATE